MLNRLKKIGLAGFIITIILVSYHLINVSDRFTDAVANSLKQIMTNRPKSSSHRYDVVNDSISQDNMKVPVVYKDIVAILLEQFRFTDSKCGPVPKIIHQTWKTENIPISFKKYITSWVRLHPDWEYWLWTDSIADEFVKRRFPAYYPMYKNYGQGIHRADAIRYFILYTFGGLYADLDMEALRPFDHLLNTHTAMIPEDHIVHSVVNWGRPRPSTLNALMTSTPKHKYLRKIIEYLPTADKATGKGDVVYKTGPFMTDDVLVAYEKSVGVESNRTVSLCDAVYFASYSRFIPEFDPNVMKSIKNGCKNPGPPSTPRGKTCEMLKRDNYTNKPRGPEVMSYHAFHHTYYEKPEYKLVFSVREIVKKPFDIKTLISNMKPDRDFEKLV
ncbi:uncharacterized protein LOC141913081 [Tubulanus polymorphus]|uniref:uncharacterized protein LOC141913081 n=1 Tax=Tubulanus polymorphus TaxID=672921 RepID=UPI003DA57273